MLLSNPILAASEKTKDRLTSVIDVKGGVFTPLYGSSKKPVQIDDFQIDEWPITNKQFLEFVKKNPQWKKSKAKSIFVDKTYLQHWDGDIKLGPRSSSDSPVVYVSWYAANKFCESRDMRLPTVNEWEYVASRPIPGQDTKKIILEWYSVPTPETLPSVKAGFENSSGVASMHGLIWEWTSDFNSTMVTGESRADASLDKTLFCGSGSIGAADSTDYAAFLRFGMRSSLKAYYTIGNLGFRCARDKEKVK